MKIAYCPFSLKNNKYVSISQEILKSLGCDVVPFDIEFFTGKNKRETKAVILNWYEPIATKNTIGYIEGSWIRKTRIILCKILGIKVIYTFHNRFPHEVNQKTINLTRKYLSWICKKSDYIIVLSKSSKQYLYDYIKRDEADRKTRYIPHPNYIGAYSDPVYQVPYQSHDKLMVLFFGQIRPYKNIELIIRLAKELDDKAIMFTVMGVSGSADYEAELREEAAGLTNINLNFGFVEDDLLEGFIRDSDILVLPYDKKSSMNSGTAILAFSNGRTVICPRIATVDDFDINNIYYYDYDREEDHFTQLKKATLQAYSDWKSNREAFELKGKKLLEEVSNNNSTRVLSQLYSKLLEEL